MKFKLSAYTIYELGQRKRQEDSIYPQHNGTTADDRLFIVCDGMGGHSGGNIASAAVCEAMSTTLNTICSEPEGPFSEDDLRTALSAAYDSLDAKDDGSEKKMGTTMTLLKFHEAGCTIAHIGDSRVYHVRPGADAASTEILFQTQDHSLVNDLVRIGELTPEEAKTSKQRNIITRAMQPNMGRRSRADIYHTTDVRPGDYFMLCSDGILEQMEDENIKYIFSEKTGDAQKKVEMIVKVTEDNSDNHSAILVKVLDVEGAPVAEEVANEPRHTAESVEEMHTTKNRRTQLAYILGMGAIVVATGLFFALRSPDEAPKGGEPSVDNVEKPVVANIEECDTATEPVAEKPKELKKRPVYDDSVDYGEPLVVEIKDRNVVMVNVSRSGGLMVDDNIYSPRDLVREGEHSRISKLIYDFLVMEDCSEKRSVEIEPGSSFDLSEGIVSLRVDPEATDEIYSEVYYEIEHAFDLYRNYVAEKLYGKAYTELESEQQNCLRMRLPAKISDADYPYSKLVIVADDKEIKVPELTFSNVAIEFDNFDFDMDVVEEEIDESEKIFTVLEDPATFQGGGIGEFRKWVMSKTRYPQIAFENGIQGNVVIEFVVDEEGKIGRIKVLQSPDPVLSEAAIKVLEDANKLKRGWKPGTLEGKAVKQKFVFTVSFKIQ